MKLRNRALARVGAGAFGLIAAAAFTAPAFAGTTADLEIQLEGTTIAASSSGKYAAVSLINHSDVPATGILVTLDLSQLDTDKVDIDEDGCSREGDLILCGINGDTIPAGGDIDWGFKLTVKSGVPGDAVGSIKATIAHDGTDPVSGNDEQVAEVVIAKANGPDLAVYAPDVDQAAEVDGEGKLQFKGELNAGETAALRYQIGNFGDVATTGLKITVELPEGVTFTEVEDDCVYAADNRSVVCTYDNFPLIPADQDDNDDDDLFSAGFFYNLITVGSGVDAPVSLTDGMVTVEPIVQAQRSMLKTETVSALPDNVTGGSADDVDASDNRDAFAVVVAGTAGGGGGLPVTGAEAGLIGGIGLAVIIAGGAVFLVARRRRVVLVTPDDEKPIA